MEKLLINEEIFDFFEESLKLKNALIGKFVLLENKNEKILLAYTTHKILHLYIVKNYLKENNMSSIKVLGGGLFSYKINKDSKYFYGIEFCKTSSDFGGVKVKILSRVVEIINKKKIPVKLRQDLEEIIKKPTMLHKP